MIPVGRGEQRLIRLRRLSEDEFEEEDFGGVMFVPLIGAEGWGAPDQEKAPEVDAQTTGFVDGLLVPARRARSIRTGLGRLIAQAAEPFDEPDPIDRPGAGRWPDAGLWPDAARWPGHPLGEPAA